jgi:putative serine protease PepD
MSQSHSAEDRPEGAWHASPAQSPDPQPVDPQPVVARPAPQPEPLAASEPGTEPGPTVEITPSAPPESAPQPELASRTEPLPVRSGATGQPEILAAGPAQTAQPVPSDEPVPSTQPPRPMSSGQPVASGPAPTPEPGPAVAVDLGYPWDPASAAPVPGSPVPGSPAAPGLLGPDPASSPVGPPRRRTGALVAGIALVALVAGLLGGIIGGWTFQQLRQNTLQDRSVTLPVPAKGTTARSADSVAGIAARLLPSVVAIKVTGNTEEGTGSGVIIDRAGYILTNNHVVEVAANGGSITIVFSDGSHAPAKVVGRDQSYDLAVVKADTGDRAALRLGDSDAVVVGDSVIAIGAPLGLQGTVTTGIVSALNRPVAAGGAQSQAFINAIQTDAAINPGNSGGPLVDASGQVIGINSAIARTPGSLGTTSGNIGVGFAIPSNQARRTAEQLIRTGRSEHPVIGVLLDRSYTGQGVKVSTSPVEGQDPVTKGGPADQAGIKPGDLIIAFNGRPVTDPDELVVGIRAQTPGDVVRLTIRRNGFDREVRVTLQASSK